MDLFDFSGGQDTIGNGANNKRKANIQSSDAQTSPKDLEPGLKNDDPRVDGVDSHSEADMEEDEDETGGPSSRPSKRARRYDPFPVVVDEFETLANREIPVNPGLTAAVDPDAGQSLLLTHQVRHQVAVPPFYNYIPISQHVSPTEPARVYPFKLDPFQQVSVYAIERNESVLVSAHTSAGKTVVAEYAIAQALRSKQRVIYTSPIKALSNQKYREMLAEFGDVGLMTGDVTINPTASCLVMTTEILRSMLYRGSEVMREVAWVIFDEIHYMRDKERGVVWEETIILLPHTVRYVFLSATIPNAMQFAEWICKTHAQPCHVVYTDFRPTPLQHYLFPAGSDGIYMVVNEKAEFREDNFQKAMGMLADKQGEDPANAMSGRNKKGKTKKGGTKGPSDIYKIVKMILARAYNPVIIFSFSKRDCEALALQMVKLEFNSTDEADMVERIFLNAMNGLSDVDQKLPQIQHLLPLLKRGIGIHHGGLLPILKEVIEILFQEGLIKVLFATETFSIGLNMPAKTVVFTNVRKFDGKDFRNLSSGEYIQMSGRAGRRGLDDRGVVIMMCDEKLEPAAAKNMVKGEADRLDSAFHLGYNMILNLMRVEGISPEYMLERCFFQFQNQTGIPHLEEELKRAEARRDSIVIQDEGNVADYYEIRVQLEELQKDVRDVITHPNYAVPFLNAGRLVSIKHGSLDFGWGIILNHQKKQLLNKNKGIPPPADFDNHPQNQYILDVLLNCASGSAAMKDKTGYASVPNGIQPCAPGERGEPLVIPVLLSIVEKISAIRIHVPKDLRPLSARETLWKSVLEVHKRFPDGLPMLDPIKNMKISDKMFVDLGLKIQALEDRLHSNPIHKDPRLPELYERYEKKQGVVAHVKAVKKKIQSAHDVLQMDELKSRKRVLRRLQFTSSADVVEMKGRVACEISSGDELLLTEMIFNGVFNPLPPEHCAALLSCFVFTEKSEQATKLREEFQAPLRQMQEMARRIAKVSKESKLPIVEDEYVQSFKVELMDVVMQWCKGASFSDICKVTDQFEGSLIRVFRRLQELIRQMASAARAIGNAELETKFNAASEMLARPNSVIFCSSLYL